jgi:transposase InsO family protein
MGAVMQVRRSGCDAYGQRHAPACVGAEEAALVARVKTIAAETRQSSGRRRRATPLPADGLAVGRSKARRLMRQAALTVQRRHQRHPVTTDRRQSYRVAPHRVARQCAVAKPTQVWVGDMT